MKIGLLTRFRPDGYEPPLQAAALSLVLENCELINYTPETPLEKPSKEQRLRQERCGRFLRLPVSGHRFENLAELQSAELPYDLLLCAGQQGTGPLDPARLGSFSSLRRAAYGLSFDTAHQPDAALRGILAGFSHLSVQTEREQTLLETLTGGQAPATVLDPLLLPTAEQWARLAAPVVPRGPYLLCDCAGPLGPLGPYITRLAAETGLPVIWLADAAPRRPKGKRIGDAGPAEVLALFRSAACVCTDSFYGTALSVLFQRPFFTGLPPADLAAPEGSRVFSLLKPLGLAHRIVGKGDAAAPADPIRWPAVEVQLSRARSASLAWLRAALENAPPAMPDKTITLPQLADRCRCTGCTACGQICPENAITMVRDREGFDYPVVDRQRCVRCGRCETVCPAGRPRETRYLPAVFAAWNENDAVRRDSASGGAFSVLADFVLEGGGVVFGAAMDGRQHLRHTACFSKEELWRLRGSKYVQSDLEGTFRMVRECLESRQVLFSGTPCQVDGLCRFLGGRPDRLITCDLICRGVSSPGLWEDMVRHIETRKSRNLQAVRFCNKVTGWQDSHLTLVYDGGRVDSTPFRRTEYGRAYLRGLTLRPACYTCPYTSMSRPGDFTLGNFWGLRPDELPDQRDRGVSLLLVNTPHGSHIFDQLPLQRRAFPAERAIAGNPALAAPTLQPPERNTFFASYALEPFDTLRKQYLTQPPLLLRAAGELLPGKRKGAKKETPR